MSGNSSLLEDLSGNSTEVTTLTNTVPSSSDSPTENHTLVYILVPLGSLLLVAILALVVMLVLRKSKLDRLRHHLMPMYSFDPADEDEDWESELLEDQDKEQQVALRIDSPTSAGSSTRYTFGTSRR